MRSILVSEVFFIGTNRKIVALTDKLMQLGTLEEECEAYDRTIVWSQ